jgi:hypothetical protein
MLKLPKRLKKNISSKIFINSMSINAVLTVKNASVK